MGAVLERTSFPGAIGESEMGLFSGLSSIFKGVAGAASGFLGGPFAPLLGAGLDFLGARADRKQQQAFAQSGLGMRIEDGARYGLHPLASAGATAGPQFQPVNAPGTWSNAFGQVGANLNNKKNAALSNELLEAQIAETRSRTLLNMANSRRGDLTSPPAISGATGGMEQLLKALDRNTGGGERPVANEPERQYPARQRVTLGKYTAWGPNPEAFELGLSEAAANAMIYGPQILVQYLEDVTRRAGEKTRAKGRDLPKKVRGSVDWKPPRDFLKRN